MPTAFSSLVLAGRLATLGLSCFFRQDHQEIIQDQDRGHTILDHFTVQGTLHLTIYYIESKTKRMMMIISKDISQTPYYTESNSMAMSAPLSTYRPSYPLPCPTVALPMEITTPKEAPSPSRKRKSRKVGFGTVNTLVYIESAFEFTQEEKDNRWYRCSTISSFKKDAKILCRTRIEDVRNGCSPIQRVRKTLGSASNSSDDLSNDSIRGLDVYAPSRQNYSKKYIQHVLEAYHVRCVGNDEHVALLAQKWSKKSLTRAMNMGEKDYLAAYFSRGEPLLEDKPLLASILMRDSQQQQVPKILTSSA